MPQGPVGEAATDRHVVNDTIGVPAVVVGPTMVVRNI